MSVPTAGSAKAQAEGTAHQAANSGAMNMAARLGFLAKGLVYALIGLLAIQVAFGDSERTDQKGALQTIADKPGGSIVLWLMVVGFAAYAVWRFSEAAWGRREETDEKKRTAKRIGSAINGAVYLFFDANRPELVPNIVRKASSALQEGGFRVSVVEQKAPAVVGLIGRR